MNAVPKKTGNSRTTGLARFADPINGIDAAQMTRAAEAELEPVRRESGQEIGNRIERLGALVHQAGNTPGDVERAEIYSAANAIYGVAGTFGLISLGQVSFLLCELLIELGRAGVWNHPAVQLHIDAMRMSRATCQIASNCDPSFASNNDPLSIAVRQATEGPARAA